MCGGRYSSAERWSFNFFIRSLVQVQFLSLLLNKGAGNRRGSQFCSWSSQVVVLAQDEGLDNQLRMINKEYKLWLLYLSQWKSSEKRKPSRSQAQGAALVFLKESSQRMGSHPDMGRTLRLLLMGLSNHSCASVVQWIEYVACLISLK